MKNLGGDAPFGGDFGGVLDLDDLFPDRRTDRIMAFDVVVPLDTSVPDAFDPETLPGYGGVPGPALTRKVALFEGMDEFGRLQPLLGAFDGTSGPPIPYTWHQPTTETPALGSTEVWEVYNFTADAHPVHLHLVNFEILDRQDFTYTVDGTRPVLQHNGAYGQAANITDVTLGSPASVGDEYYESAPKDMVSALPGDPDASTGQMVRIRATFDKPGRYVWHCHILSHEDHEMMRVLQVG